MSRTAVAGLQGNFEHVFGLAMQYIDVCPDAIWGKKFGSWPVWQQLYHSLSSVDFFLRPEGVPQAKALYEPAVGDFKETPAPPADKAAFRTFAAGVKKVVDEYCTSLTDAKLGEINAGLSKRFGRDFTHAATLSLISGHIFYHLGSCDAALRENGLKGVF